MGTPAEVVLRMLVLKHLRDWSYDELEREVTGSLVHRRFCRIDAARVRMPLSWPDRCRRCIGWAAIANNLVAIGRYQVGCPSS